MTKKNDNTLLLVGGGLLAVVALGALVLGRRPTGDGAGTSTLPTGSFFDKSGEFGVHNVIGFSGGYTNPFADWLSGKDPFADPLAPKDSRYKYYDDPVGKYAGQYTSPPATSSPTDSSSGFTPAGSTSGGSYSNKYGNY